MIDIDESLSRERLVSRPKAPPLGNPKKRWSEIRKGRPGQVNNLGKRWWNDGIKSYLKYECPEGCVLGRLPLSPHREQ